MKLKTSTSAFHGVFAALVTPMKANEKIDYATLGAFSDYLIGYGAHGLIPLGSTGEYYALSPGPRGGIRAILSNGSIFHRLPGAAGNRCYVNCARLAWPVPPS